MTANPCTHRFVTNDGRILCTRIAGADQEVWPDLCDRCPARAIGCACLRFTLARAGSGAILVRQAGGRSYLLEPEPDALQFQRAACAAYGQPITSPASCQGCRSVHAAAARATVIPFPATRSADAVPPGALPATRQRRALA
jgi:hypothetical protein